MLLTSLIIYLIENTFFLHVVYRQDFHACITTAYLESHISPK